MRDFIYGFLLSLLPISINAAHSIIGSDYIETAALSPDGKLIMGTYASGKMLLYDVKDKPELLKTACHKGSIMDLAFSADGKKIVSVGGGFVSIWRSHDLKELASFPYKAHQARFSPRGEELLISGIGLIKVINVSTGEEIFSIPQNDVAKAFFNHQGDKILIINFNQNSLALYDLAQKMLLSSIEAFWPSDAAFSHDDSKIFIASGLQIKVYDFATSQMRLAFNNSENDFSDFENWILQVTPNKAGRILSAIDNKGHLLQINISEKSHKKTKTNASLKRSFFMQSEASTLIVASKKLMKLKNGEEKVVDILLF